MSHGKGLEIISLQPQPVPRRGMKYLRGGLVALAMLSLTACSVELYSDLNQKQANEIVAALMRNGIAAQREIGKGGAITVLVQKERFADAMAILSQNGLPKDEFSNLGQVFKRDGLVSSPTEERMAMIYGLSQELSQTVSEIDGVLSARVHLVLPENNPLRDDVTPSSASVFIRHHASAPINELLPQVKMLIAKSVSGLTYDNVSITLVPVEAPPVQSSAEAGYVAFMGLWIHPDSLTTARLLFFGLIGALLIPLGILLSTQIRKRRGAYALPAETATSARKP